MYSSDTSSAFPPEFPSNLLLEPTAHFSVSQFCKELTGVGMREFM